MRRIIHSSANFFLSKERTNKVIASIKREDNTGDSKNTKRNNKTLKLLSINGALLSSINRKQYRMLFQDPLNNRHYHRELTNSDLLFFNTYLHRLKTQEYTLDKKKSFIDSRRISKKED